MFRDARRYQTSFAGPQFSSLSVAQQVQYAVNNHRQLASYIKGGGLKPMIGEWALAGEFWLGFGVKPGYMLGSGLGAASKRP